MRRWAVVVALGVVTAACTPGSSPSTSSATSSTTSTSVTTPGTSSQVPELERPDLAPGEVTLEWVGDAEHRILVEGDEPAGEPPASLSLDRCFERYPQWVTFDISVAADDYPATLDVGLAVLLGDVGGGAAVEFTIEEPSKLAITVPLLYFGDGGEADVGRPSVLEPGQVGCLATGLDGDIESHALLGEPRWESPLPTAPPGSWERLAQTVDSPEHPFSPLASLLVRSLVSDRFDLPFLVLPDPPHHLEGITFGVAEPDRLDQPPCPSVELVFADFTLTQSLGCPLVRTDPTWTAGQLRFARAKVGDWDVVVSTEDDPSALIDDLTVYPSALYDGPVVPEGEEELDRRRFEGRTVVVSSGATRASSGTGPEFRIFVYEVSGDALDQVAEIPWVGCVAVYEGPAYGVLVRGDPSWTVSAVIDGDTVAFDPGDQVVWLGPGQQVEEVEVTDDGGDEPPNCSGNYAVGRPQGVGSTTTSTAPGPGAEIVVVAEPGAGPGPEAEALAADWAVEYAPGSARLLGTFTGPTGSWTVVTYEPMAMEGDEPYPPGSRCAVAFRGDAGMATCFGEEPRVALGGDTDSFQMMALLPVEAETVRLIVENGTIVVADVLGGVTMIEWPRSWGEPVELTYQPGDVPLSWS